jgi:hypothetical protein
MIAALGGLTLQDWIDAKSETAENASPDQKSAFAENGAPLGKIRRGGKFANPY